MRKWIACWLMFFLVSEVLVVAGVRGRDAKYVGGTIAALAENAEGQIDLEDSGLVFVAKKGGTRLAIPYDRIESIEYGQKAGRRVGVALTVSPLFLFSKKRKHYVTIGFLDETGKKQGAVFELAKGIVKETLSTLETKSGKKVEYESDEARKHLEKQK